MAMNTTLKTICGLLKRPDPELRLAAVRVLDEVQSKEPGVHRALGELLVESKEPEVIAAVLGAMEHAPHDQSVKYLIQLLDKSDSLHERVLDVLAAIGPKLVPVLKQQFHRLPPLICRELVQVLPKLRTPQSHAFLIDCYFNSDHDLVREGVHALRNEIEQYTPKERQEFQKRLHATLSEKRIQQNDAALSAVIISLGILGLQSSKAQLKPYLDAEFPQQVRRHALMSLARLGLSGDKHHDLFEAVQPILDEADYDGLVRHAVALLDGLKPQRNDTHRLKELLHSRHAGLCVYAISALAQLDNLSNAEEILGFLHHPDAARRDAASAALSRMPSAVEVILRHIDETKNRAEAFEMVRILESHGNRIKPARAKAMLKHLLELFEEGDEHYRLYHQALLHLRPDTLKEGLLERAKAAWKAKDFARVRDMLKLLDETDLMTEEIRYQLALAKLKTSKKDHARAFRLTDYCLEHFAILLRADPKGFQKKLLTEKILAAEDFLYLGYHFSERLNEERRFGVGLLRHVIKKWPKGKPATLARKKIKIEGH